MAKNLKTIVEDKKGKNLKSINKKTGKQIQNKELIKKAKKKQLPGYHVVKMKNGTEYLRSNPNKIKKDNLDPKIQKLVKKKTKKKK